MFGKLTLSAIPFDEPIIMITYISIILIGLSISFGITYFKKWKYLWSEWFTTVDHKKYPLCMEYLRSLCYFVVLLTQY